MDDLQSLIDSGRIGGAALKRVMDRRGLSDLTPAPREEQPAQPSAWWAQTGGEGDNDTRLDSESQQTQAMQNRLLGANPSTGEIVQNTLANPGQFLQTGAIAGPKTIRGYHGTSQDVSDVDLGKGGSRGGVPSDQGVTYFFPDEKKARGYGDNIVSKDISLENAKTYDASQLVNDPSFVKDMRQSFWENATRNDELKKRAASPEGQARIDRQWQQHIEKFAPGGMKWNDSDQVRYDPTVTGAILKRARAEGAHVAVVKNMAEGHGPATDQYLVLNDKALSDLKGR